MADKPRISDAEWQVMQVLWEKSPRTVKEIVSILSSKTSWKSETIRTLVNRLAKKQVIAFEQKGRRYHFYPLVSQEDYVKTETHSFLARAGSAMLKPMLATFIEKETLSAKEIEELQRILDKKGKG